MGVLEIRKFSIIFSSYITSKLSHTYGMSSLNGGSLSEVSLSKSFQSFQFDQIQSLLI